MLNNELYVKELNNLESRINYTFKDIKNLARALTHSSYANENRNKMLQSNERLEFLGDSILNAIISEHIYRRIPELTEGEMTRVRASIVCEPSLMKCADNIELGKCLLLGKGEERTGGRKRISILSDSFEALIGAIFIDGDMEHAREFILSQMEEIIEGSVNGITQIDYKTRLQEIIQKNSDSRIVYEMISESGPDHDKHFKIQVKINELIRGTGQGKSKKEAEQNAARDALEKAGV